MYAHLTAESLTDLLLTVPGYTPGAVALLDTTDPDPDALVDATLELIAYTDACKTAASRLLRLSPVPLNIPIPGFIL